MGAASYNTDLTDLVADSATVNDWSALGGGSKAMNVETDYFLEGTRCISKNAWAGADKGMMEDSTLASLTAASGKAVYTWVTHATPGSLAVKSSGGISICLGSSASVFNEYQYAGSDTIDYGAPWICAVVDPDEATQSSGTVTTANMDSYGARANLPVGGPTKGAPFGIDEIRYGRSIEINDGVGAAADFTALALQNDSITNRWGQFQRTPGSAVNFTQQCRLEFGDTTNTTACLFTDSNKNITIPDLEHVATDFIEYDVTQASTVNLTNIAITATSGANTKGNWVTTSATAVTFTGCVFTNMGTFGLSSAYTVLNSTFRSCDSVTQNGATLTGTIFDTSTTATGALIADDLDIVTGCTFNSTASTGYHAVDLGTISATATVAWDNKLNSVASEWTGSAGTTVGSNVDLNAAIDVNVASGQTLTIATTSASTIPTVQNSGSGTVIITANTVVVSVTVRDNDSGSLLSLAHVQLFKTSDYSTVVLSGATSGTGIVQDPAYNYTSDEDVEGWVRQMDIVGTDYVATNISGTITSSGLALAVRLNPI